MLVEAWKMWVGICAGLATIITTSAYFVAAAKKINKNVKDVQEGVKCMLRKDMMDTYYGSRDDKTLHEYEKKNFLAEYEAYKALGGNSFVDDICAEIRKWDIAQ